MKEDKYNYSAKSKTKGAGGCLYAGIATCLSGDYYWRSLIEVDHAVWE